LRKYINYIIIIVLIVAGIGSCGYASTKTGNSGWDGMQHRKAKLLKLLGVSLAAYSVNLIVLFGLTKQFGSMDYLAAILPAAIIIVSYLCLLNELKFARTIWITVLIYLLISSISFLIVSAGKSSYNIFCIGIPIAYSYTISILVRSRVVNIKNTD